MTIYRFYLYRYIRVDTKVPFYVGIGTKPAEFNTYQQEYKRAFNKSNRSEHCKRTCNKTEIRVDILFESDDYEEIKEKEREFIKLYGRMDLGKGTLVNHTDGGEGMVGYVVSEETRAKRSKGNIGKKRTEETRANMSKAATGRKHSIEHIEKAAAFHRGKKLTQETKNKIAAAFCKLVMDINTGKIYPSVKQAALEHNVTAKYLSAMLTGRRINKTTLIYV